MSESTRSLIGLGLAIAFLLAGIFALYVAQTNNAIELEKDILYRMWADVIELKKLCSR